MTYPIFTVTPEMTLGEFGSTTENNGYLTKFWIEHPTLGNSLVKLDEEGAAQAWTEKIPYQIALLLKLPAARYEFGELQGFDEFPDSTQVVVSPNFRQPGLDYIPGQNLLIKDGLHFDYTVEEILPLLERNNLGLPENYPMISGIQDGADLFVGYLLLDALVANNDRHSGNWSYSESVEGTKALTPIYDNGSSFGVSFGSLVWQNYTPERYMKTDLSRFGDFQIAVLSQAASIKPLAASIWLKQLSKITPQQINHIFNQIPAHRISDEAKIFAQNLLKYNLTQLADLSQQINKKLDSEQEQRARDILPTAAKIFSYQKQQNQTISKGNLETFEGKIYKLSWNTSESILELSAQDNRDILAKYDLKAEEARLIFAKNITVEDVNQWKKVQQIFDNIESQNQTRNRGFRL